MPTYNFSMADIKISRSLEKRLLRLIMQRSRRPRLPSSILTLHTKVLQPRWQSFPPHLSHFSPLALSIWEPLHQKASVEAGSPSQPLMQHGLNGCQVEYLCHISSFLGQQCLRLKLASRQNVSPDWNKWRKGVKSKERRRNCRHRIMTHKLHNCKGNYYHIP